jgi:hypothetical protein
LLVSLLFLTGLFMALLFFVRLVVAQFSDKVRALIYRRPVLHIIWGLAATGYFFVFYALTINPSVLSPNWLERRRQRSVALERVQIAGGWDAVKRDCVALVTNNPEQRFFWYARVSTNPLPAAIATLEPQQITLQPREPAEKGKPVFSVVRIKIFGMHSSGGHSIPYYGLDVVCESSSTPYQPESSQAAAGNSHFKYRKVAENIYEVY